MLTFHLFQCCLSLVFLEHGFIFWVLNTISFFQLTTSYHKIFKIFSSFDYKLLVCDSHFFNRKGLDTNLFLLIFVRKVLDINLIWNTVKVFHL